MQTTRWDEDVGSVRVSLGQAELDHGDGRPEIHATNQTRPKVLMFVCSCFCSLSGAEIVTSR